MVISVIRSQTSLDDGNIDYATYSCAALLDARSNIQREPYPQNYENLRVEIAMRPALATNQESSDQTSIETVFDAAIGKAVVEVVLALASTLP